MSREIKFRAWHQTFGPYSKGIMHYFSLQDLFENEDHEGDLFTAQGILDLESLKKNPLMQYTGLKDARGKEIYEGDIVFVTDSTGQESINIIEMNDGCWGIQSNATGRDYLKCYTVNNAVEIIGNISENPELLETK